MNAAEFYFPSGPGPGGFLALPIDKDQVVTFWELSVTCSEMGCDSSAEKIRETKGSGSWGG